MQPLRLLRVIIVLSLLFFCQYTFASAIKTAADFASIQRFINTALIKDQHLRPQEILLVLDDDNTLTTNKKDCKNPSARSCQYLGGVAWFDWQNGLLSTYQQTGQRSKDLVATNFNGLLAVQRFLFQNTKMDLTDPALPRIIKQLQSHGVSVMMEGARDPWMHGITEEQLKLNGLVFKHSGLPPPEGIAGNFIPSKRLCGVAIATHKIARYEDGIYTVNGQDKGKMLQCLFNLTGDEHLYKAIVFVDDKNYNIQSMYRQFVHSSLSIYAFHFTREDRSVAAFLTGPNASELQQAAAKKWQIIVATLNAQLPDH